MQTSIKPREPRPVVAQPVTKSIIEPTIENTLNTQSVISLDNMTGPELIAYIAQFPTLDAYLDRDPYAQPLTDAELLRLIEKERAERALFNIKEQKREDKRNGINTDDDTTGESDDGTSD